MTENLTKILNSAEDQSQAMKTALPLVYNELRAIAAVHLRQERPGHTLLATDLVHEAYLRLFEGKTPQWNDKKHFFATAAVSMRRILVDHARKKTSIKRTDPENGIKQAERPELGPQLSLEDVLDLDIALQKLQKLDEKQCQIVQLRVFAGLTENEIAELMEISRRSVAREWWSAKLWLREQMSNE